MGMDVSSQLFEAIANESRMSMLKFLHGQERYIAEIVQETRLSRPAVCFHLNILEKAGIVQSEYRILEPPHFPSGKAARYYKINSERYKKAKDELSKRLDSTNSLLVKVLKILKAVLEKLERK